ncbi:Mitochondrial copper homeostasis protein [Mortierella polycephala]|uniref:Mitochondrial copper homeostasis protein n=1 Tax=Mortierella polycephala TaxID=41804 RepID=A0A9P6PVS8_9FUNG|nr:Mitochondrial copper homeostasis protein [Mortierella polycephala]
MSTEQKPQYTSGNNTTMGSSSANDSAPRGPRKRHEHIVTSEEELKVFNKGYNSKAQSQYMDPCRAQTKASMKCMDDNNYDKRRCTRFFKDYSDCKKKWMETLREERRKRNLGIIDDDTPDAEKETASS